MKTYEPHAAALLIPPASKEDFERVKRSIEQNGQEFPAVLYEGKLLDGRTRQEAIKQLLAEKRINPKTELKVVPYRGGSVPGFVRAANVDRRHLSEGQFAMIARKLLPLFQKEAKQRQAQAARDTTAQKKSGKRPLSAPARKASAAELAAEAAGGKVSARSVERADFIAKNDPKLAEAVFRDEVTLKQAEKQIRHRDATKQIKAYVPPKGKFSVVTTDYPWEYDDTLDGSDRMRGGLPYPPMKPAEIVHFVKTVLADVCDEVCLYGCWVTNTIMLDFKTWVPVWEAIESIGFRPVKLETWRKTEKDGGDFTGTGNGVRNDTEQLVLFARGRVVYNELGAEHGRPLQRTCFSAPVGEHSEKPALAYERLEQLVAYQSRLEMFARAQRPGWTTSGAELAQAPVSGESAPARPALPKSEGASAEADPSSFSQQGGSGSVVTAREWHGCADPRGHSFVDGKCEVVGCGEDLTESERSDSLVTENPSAEQRKSIEETIAQFEEKPLDHARLNEPFDAAADAFECANCKATFVSREILSKHAKACGEVVSVVDAIAAGATIIEVEADRAAVVDEVDRLEDLKPELGTPDERKLFKLKLALEAFRKLKRDTKELVRERKAKPAIGFEPPVDAASLQQPDDTDVGF